MLDFDRLQTPQGDGEILIEPPPAEWPGLMAENARRRRDWPFAFAGEPADSVIKQTRAAIGDGPVIAGGHQPAFVHPGVWAKHAVIHHASESFGVRGLDFVVDNDAPRSAALAVPVAGSDGLIETNEIALTHAPAGSAYEGRPPLSSAEIQHVEQELKSALGDRFEGCDLPAYLAGLHHGVTRDAVEQHLLGRARIDARLQADLPEARVSSAFGGLFLADLLLNPQPFAAAYNQALAQYRKDQAVRSPDRPLPDLQRQQDRIETALWIYQPLHRRQRLWVARTGDRIELFAEHVRIGVLPAKSLARDPDSAVAILHPWLIRPRALTLTLWARLLACDLFVHGIGGAKYDRITDDIIRRYYRCPPPGYACVTATLRLPLPKFEATPEKVLASRRQLRDWRFNPQRFLSSAPRELLDERNRLIALSARLRAERAPRPARREIYQAIDQSNDRLRQIDPQQEATLLARIERLERELSSDMVASSRDFFYALQPHDRLMSLAGRLCEGW